MCGKNAWNFEILSERAAISVMRLPESSTWGGVLQSGVVKSMGHSGRAR